MGGTLALDYTDLFFKELCPAILQALRPENKLGNIKIVCFDDEQETLAAIKRAGDLRNSGPAGL